MKVKRQQADGTIIEVEEDNTEVLTRIDAGVINSIKEQAAQRERIAKLEKDNNNVLSRLTAADETIKSYEETLIKLESELNKRRFNTGSGSFLESDALFNALPDDLKKWVPRVTGLRQGVVRAGDKDAFVRGASEVAFAKRDPVGYVAVGGWMQAHIKASLAQRKGKQDEAAKWIARADKLAEAMGGFEEEARAGLIEDTGSLGGYLVPTLLETVIGLVIKDNGVLRGAGATVVSMQTKTHQLPSLANDFSLTWHLEGNTMVDAAPAAPFSQTDLTAKRLDGLVSPTIELIQDNITNLMGFIFNHLLAMSARAEDIQGLEGDGTVFTGLFSVAGINSVAGSSAAITWQKWIKAAYAGEHAQTIDGGSYFCHPWVVRDLITTGIVNSGTDGFAMMGGVMINLSPAGSIQPTSIGGKSVYTTSAISRLRNGAPGVETTVYHGRPEYIIIGDRMGTAFEANPWSETEWKSGKISLRFLRRVGICIWVPAYFTKLTAITVAA